MPQKLQMKYLETSQADMFFRVEFVLHVSVFPNMWAQSVSGMFCVSCVPVNPPPVFAQRVFSPRFLLRPDRHLLITERLTSAGFEWMVVDGWVRTPFVHGTWGEQRGLGEGSWGVIGTDM